MEEQNIVNEEKDRNIQRQKTEVVTGREKEARKKEHNINRKYLQCMRRYLCESVQDDERRNIRKPSRIGG